MPHLRRFFALVLLLCSVSSAWAQDFLDPEDAFVLTVTHSDAGALRLHWKIADGYYLYRDRIQVSSNNSPLPLELPAGTAKDDPTFGHTEVFHHQLQASLPAPAAASLTITWQGCADAGLCYPPQTQTIALDQSHATHGTDLASDSGITSALSRYSLWLTLPAALLLGLGLAFTPCMLPMLPIITSIVAGVKAGPGRAAALSTVYVLSMAITYAALGVAAALAGASLQVALQGVWMTAALAGLFALLALAMFGFYTLQLPGFLRERLDRANRHQQGGSWLGVGIMGVFTALLVGPCMTAPLAGTLLYIAQTGNAAYGALLLFLLGLGMGLPTIVVASFGSRLLPKPGMWMTRINHGFGFLLLATAIWTLQTILPPTVVMVLWGVWSLLLASACAMLALGMHKASRAAVVMVLWGVWSLLLASACAMLALGMHKASRAAVVTAAASAASLVWGTLLLIGAASGQTDPLRPLAPQSAPIAAQASPFITVNDQTGLQAQLAALRAANKPAILVFSADWCISCHELERKVFDQSSVRTALRDVQWIKMDVTQNSAVQRSIMQRYRVIGPPTVVFLDGRADEQARLVGEFEAAALLTRADAIKG